MNGLKRPIQKSLVITCSVFVAVMCALMAVQTFLMFRSWYYGQYEKTLAHVLNTLEHRIDIDDVQECIQTGVPSEKHAELQRYFNEFLVDNELAYLEINIPREDGTLVNVVTATTPEERAAGEQDWPLLYEDSESFTAEEIVPYLKAWDSTEITYFENESDWGKCYTACKPLFASDGQEVGLLCADLYTKNMHAEVNLYVGQCMALVLGGGLLFVVLLLMWLRHDVTEPIQQLEESARSFAQQSHGRRDPAKLRFDPPPINTQNEVESLSEAITQMSEDMHDYVEDILLAEQLMRNAQEQAAGMSKLAFEDELTHVKSKAAYARKVESLVLAIEGEQHDPMFAVLMVDLNNLKYVNDTFGHEHGDAYLKGSCHLLTSVFGETSVYRTGGDEFVVILQGTDYAQRTELLAQVEEAFARTQADMTVEPWERFSAAFGMAVHVEGESYKSVFARADDEMYAAKTKMKRELGMFVKPR